MIRLGALGDVVRTMPAVADLRRLYPESRISWLVEPKSAGAVAAHPDVDEVLVFPRDVLEASLSALRARALARTVREVVRCLRRGNFDLVVDFHGILKSGVLSRVSGAARRYGYGPPAARELSWLFANRRAPLPTQRLSRYARNAALVSHLSGEVDHRGVQAADVGGPFRLRPDPAKLDAHRDALGSAVVIHPGTSMGTPYKRYPIELYGEVARALASDPGLACLVAAGPSPAERSIARAVVEAAAGAARLAPETPEFSDLVALHAASRLFIGADSGPLHVASMVGTPVVQILGPTDPIQNEPHPGTPSRQVRIEWPCSPCRRGCAQAPCMTNIAPEQVVAAARDLLAKTEDVGSGRAS